MKLVSTDYYWKLNSRNIQQIVNFIIESELPFQAHELIFLDEYTIEEGKEVIQNIDFNKEVDISIIVTGDNYQRLYLTAHNWGKHRLIKVAISHLAEQNSDFSFSNVLLGISDLICCFIYDTKDEQIQSETSIRRYEIQGLELSNIVRTKDKAGRLIIDTSSNFGRSVHAIGIKFIAGSRMYFGDCFFNIIPRELLLKIDMAYVIEIGENKLIEINLFDLFEKPNAQTRAMQKYFLDVTSIFNTAEGLNENYWGFDIAVNSLGL